MSDLATPTADRSRRIVDGLGFLEAPRWALGRLWFSDFASRWVSTTDRAGTVTRKFYVAGQPSGLAVADDGSVLVASMYDGRILRGDDGGTLEMLADLGTLHRGCLGDMAVAPNGRIFVSTLPDLNGHDPLAAPRCPILTVAPDGTTAIAAADLRIPNGLAVTPDGTGLIVAETQAARLLRLPIATDGTLGAPEVFADLGGRRPDGLCLSPDGAIWVCSPFTSEVLLVERGGAVRRVFATPGSWAVACALNADAAELYVLTAQVTIDDFRRGGGVGAIRVFDLERP